MISFEMADDKIDHACFGEFANWQLLRWSPLNSKPYDRAATRWALA
jgi:hypothetical protein